MAETDMAELRRQAAMGDVLAQFELNLQQGQGAKTTARLSQLKLRPVERRLRTRVNREMAMVAPELVEIMRKLVSGKAPWPLFLYGASGRGKTCAALALCDFADTAAYFTAEELADAAMGGDTADLWSKIRDKDLIVIDEIGERAKVGDLAYTTLKRVADLREEHKDGVAVYVSNVGPADLAALFDDRIASRLLCGTVFELTGSDRRFST